MIVVGVSAGIDSMVLLDMLYKEGYDIVVAHVNYQKRTESYIDAQIIKEYIKDKDIKYEELVVIDEMYNNDNFQKQARVIRYNFFKEVCNKYNINDVYLAHHKDDYLETYIFKKKRRGLYKYYGIEKETIYNGMNIHRPLLNMYKSEIEEYANNYSIAYHQDITNYSLDYTRNKIRDELLNHSIDEKEKIYKESIEENKQAFKEEQEVEKYYNRIIDFLDFKKLDKNIQRRLLYKVIQKPTITTKHLDDLIEKILSTNSFRVTFLDTTIAKAYDNIYILDKFERDYDYLIKTKNDFLVFRDKFKNEYGYDLKDPNIDYPFVIRNYSIEDFDFLDISYPKFRKKIKKNKVPFFLRDYLPIVVKDGKPIEFL